MYKKLIFVLCVAVGAVSCLKNDNNTTCPYQQHTITIPSAEQMALDTYVDTNNIDAVKDPSGIYYHIITPGTGTDSVKLCSQIQITYKGQLVNDSIFDQQTNAVYVLGSLIEGWKKIIPLIKRGGQLKMYIPPTLGYGSNDIKNQSGVVVIPKNSILKFEVQLTDYSAGN